MMSEGFTRRLSIGFDSLPAHNENEELADSSSCSTSDLDDTKSAANAADGRNRNNNVATVRRMPAQKPARSKQDYGTPWELIHAVEARWDALRIDLAATDGNAKAGDFISPTVNSLEADWIYAIGDGLAWLNPPFADIEPWAERCYIYSDCNIIMLVPASIGAEWFAKHVEGKAKVVGLRPRLTFQGCKDPYPKDCMLCLYGPMFADEPVFSTWRWK